MFNSYYESETLSSENPTECKPDPEKQLARTRQKKAEIEKCKTALIFLKNSSIKLNVSGEIFLQMLGSIEIAALTTAENEERFLQEIQKESETL